MTHGPRTATAGLMLAVLSLGAPAAGAEAERGDGAPPLSGFLGDYSDLSPLVAKKRSSVLLYVREAGVLGRYDAFLVEPPLIYFHADARGGGVDPQELAMLASALRDAVIEELRRGGYRVVDEPGPGVLRLRGAITEVVPVNPVKNVGATAAGVVAGAGAAPGVGLLVPRIDLGQASIEVEMLDGESGERMVAIVAERQARRFGGKLQGAKRWGDVKAAFRWWAERLRERLDELHEQGNAAEAGADESAAEATEGR